MSSPVKQPEATGAIKAAWIAGILGCIGVTFAAVIGLGLPYVERLANESEPTPVVVVATVTPPPPTLGPSVAQPTATTGTQVPSPAISTPTAPPIRPPGTTVPPGGEFSPTGEWVWICTGDFSVTRAGGTVINLFDELESSGLIVVFAQNSRVNAFALYGGYCEPFAPEAKGLAVSSKLSTMLTSSMQCENGCSTVNVKELDQDGNVINDYWKP